MYKPNTYVSFDGSYGTDDVQSLRNTITLLLSELNKLQAILNNYKN